MSTGIAKDVAEHAGGTVGDHALVAKTRGACHKDGQLDDLGHVVERSQLLLDPPEKVDGALAGACLTRGDVNIVAESSDGQKLRPHKGDLARQHEKVIGPDRRTNRRIGWWHWTELGGKCGKCAVTISWVRQKYLRSIPWLGKVGIPRPQWSWNLGEGQRRKVAARWSRYIDIDACRD